MRSVRMDVTVTARARDAVLRALRILAAPLEVRRDFRGACIGADPARPDRLRFEVTWADDRALEEFLCSDIMETLLEVLELSVEPPDLRIGEHARDESFALLVALRRRALGAGASDPQLPSLPAW